MRRLRYTVMAAMAMMRPQRGVVWRLELHEKRARRQVVVGGHVQGCIWIDARDQASFLMEPSVTTVAIEAMQHRSG